MNSPGPPSAPSAPSVPSAPSTAQSPLAMPAPSSQPAASTPSSSAPRGAARRPPKLRSSCDACGAAKVRCDKTQPRCGRCAAGGMTCVYGLSRKFGKAPRKKAPSETSVSGDAGSKSMAQSAQQKSLSCFPDYRPLSGGTPRPVKYEPTSPSFGLDDSLIFTSHAGHDIFIPSPDAMENFNDPFSFADAPHGPSTIVRVDSRQHGTVDPLDLTFSGSDYSGFSEWIQPPDELMHTPESQPASDADSGCMAPSHRMPTSFSSVDSFLDASLLQTDSHHCQKLAYATLDSLSLKQDGAGGGEHLVQTMDTVLNRNKQAVENMRQLLACPCSRSPHLAMLYASITSKILMWYQLAAGCARPAATATPTWDSFPPLASHQPTPPLSASSSPAAISVTPAASPVGTTAAATTPQAGHRGDGGGFVVTPLQFSAGTFSVDDEAAQEALRTQLLLSELRKAGHLIDLLCVQGTGGRAGEAVAGGVPGEVNDIYSTLGAWLKSELNRTVGLLQT